MDWSAVSWSGGAFWAFMAVVILANVWREIAEKRAVHETIRLAIEKNYPLDAGLLENLKTPHPRKNRTDRLAGGAAVLAVGLGLPLMGYFIRLGGDPDAFFPLLGVGSLLVLVGLALLLTSGVSRSNTEQADVSRRSL